MPRLQKILILLASLCHTGYAQNVNTLFDKYRQAEKAEYVSLSPFMLRIIKFFSSFSNDEAANYFTKHIRSVRVLDMEECPAKTKKQFIEEVSKCRFKGYEELFRATEDDGQMQVFAKMKGETIHDLLVLTTGDDCLLVQIKGRLNPEELGDLVNSDFVKRKKE